MNKKGMRATLIAMLFFCSMNSASADADSFFDTGNERYAAGDYAEALHAYEQGVRTEGASTELYYNMGNVYVQMNEKARALLSYYRAQELSPRDPKIKKNIDFVRSQFDYRIDDKTGWYVRQVRAIFSIVSDGEVSLFLQVSIFLFLSLLLLYVINRRRPLVLIVCILAGMVCASAICFYAVHVYVCNPGEYALVMDTAALRYGPQDTGKVVFSLPEAYPVYVVDRRASWSQVVLLNKESGWVRNEYIEVV